MSLSAIIYLSRRQLPAFALSLFLLSGLQYAFEPAAAIAHGGGGGLARDGGVRQIGQDSAQTEPGTARTQTKNGPQKPKAPLLTIHDKWAVLVGVGHYQDTAVKPIKYASRNVLSLTQTLCDPQIGHFLPDHVLVATEDKVTRQTLADSTWENWLTKRALPNDMIVLYICTRFVPTDDVSDILLLTSESKLASKETSATSLSSILGEVRRRTQCKNIIAMLDIAPTEAVANSYPYGFGLLMQSIAKKSGASIFCADDRMLGSTDDPQARQSFFVEYIGEGMKAGGGAMPIEAIASYVSQIMVNYKDPADAKAGDYHSHPLLFASAENPDLVKMPLGMSVHKNGDIAGVKFGKSLAAVAQTDPALAAHLAALDQSTNGQGELKQLLKAQDEAAARAEKEEKEEQEDENDDAAPAENVDFAPYMAAMKKSIQAKWTTPKGLDQKTVVAVFSILKDGRIAEPEIVESSGNSTIDQSALKALADASPLPPLPKGAPKKIQIRYKFDWKVTNK
ncbi:MAG: energy transducer TonB [Cyanobacteria bacterium REEB67]|nr:energy transducer TonB [Cyanobacteria bacterium REEB67]